MDADRREPIRALAYQVSRADVLAWVVHSHRLDRWEKLRLLLLISVAGFAAAAVPRDIGPVLWWVVVAVLLLGAGAGSIVWTNVGVRKRADMLPIPLGPIELQEFDDGLVEDSNDVRRMIPPGAVRAVIWADHHLFITTSAQPVIIPKSVFRDFEDMQVFADRIEERSGLPGVPPADVQKR